MTRRAQSNAKSPPGSRRRRRGEPKRVYCGRSQATHGKWCSRPRNAAIEAGVRPFPYWGDMLPISSLQGRFGGSQRVTAWQGHNQKQNRHTLCAADRCRIQTVHPAGDLQGSHTGRVTPHITAQNKKSFTKAKKCPAGQMTAPGLRYLQFIVIVKRFDSV